MEKITYNVEVPGIEHGSNYYIPTGQERISGNEGEIYSLLNFLNDYLRYIIAAVLFFALIYGGIRTLTSNGTDGAKFLKDTIIGAGIGIMVAVFSYTIIRIITNLI